MTTSTYHPWRELDGVLRAMRLSPIANVSRTRSGHAAENHAEATWRPAVDISETDEAYRIALEVAGVAPEDVEISVHAGALKNTGERVAAVTKEGQEERSHRSERAIGKFSRSFTLPENADAEQIDANAQHGVITLTVAKRQAATPRKISVASTG